MHEEEKPIIELSKPKPGPFGRFIRFVGIAILAYILLILCDFPAMLILSWHGGTDSVIAIRFTGFLIFAIIMLITDECLRELKPGLGKRLEMNGLVVGMAVLQLWRGPSLWEAL